MLRQSSIYIFRKLNNFQLHTFLTQPARTNLVIQLVMVASAKQVVTIDMIVHALNKQCQDIKFKVKPFKAQIWCSTPLRLVKIRLSLTLKRKL